MDLHQLLLSIEKLRSRAGIDPEDENLLFQYEIEVANVEALEYLKENPVFIGLMDLYRRQIKQIDGWILINSKEMLNNPDVQRKATYLIAKKEMLTQFIDHFSLKRDEFLNHVKGRVDYFLNK